MKMTIRLLSLALAIAFSCVTALANSVVITGGVTDWTASSTATLSYDAISKTLTETATFGDLNPLTITFGENVAASSSNFGLRIHLSHNITNNSGFGWQGFTEDLRDSLTPPGCAPYGTVHPAFAHFHSDPFSFGAFSLTGGGSSLNCLNLGGGTVSNGALWASSGIGIHESEVLNSQRTFTLVQTPARVPEPGTLVLLSLGVGAIACRLRRQRI